MCELETSQYDKNQTDVFSHYLNNVQRYKEFQTGRKNSYTQEKDKFKNHMGFTVRVFTSLGFYTKLFNDFLCIYHYVIYPKIGNNIVLL